MAEKERKTKAGMMNSGGEKEVRKVETEKTPEDLPKISKEKAEERDRDRPPH